MTQFVGTWAHTTEMQAHGYLPYALARFGLMPRRLAPPFRSDHTDVPGKLSV